MANAPSAAPKKGKRKLIPFYVGITESKSLKNKTTRHTHYVLIDERVIPRLGIKLKGTTKPGGSDVEDKGLIYQLNRKKTRGDKKNVTAKRFIKQSSRSITAYCKVYLKNKEGKEIQESYSMGFPSSVSLRLIIKFFKDFCFNVESIGTGKNRYQVR